MSLILAGTGHRPDKLGGYSTKALNKFIDLAADYLEETIAVTPVTQVISGMALGWDTALCIAALDLDIPVCAAIPCHGQELPWLLGDRKRYQRLLSQCSDIWVAEEEYSPKSMQKRNQWMVDQCDRLVALWDGSKGGTGNTIRYATGKVEIVNLWDKFNRNSDFLVPVSFQVKN